MKRSVDVKRFWMFCLVVLYQINSHASVAPPPVTINNITHNYNIQGDAGPLNLQQNISRLTLSGLIDYFNRLAPDQKKIIFSDPDFPRRSFLMHLSHRQYVDFLDNYSEVEWAELICKLYPECNPDIPRTRKEQELMLITAQNRAETLIMGTAGLVYGLVQGCAPLGIVVLCCANGAKNYLLHGDPLKRKISSSILSRLVKDSFPKQ